jgi:hypothetical protein
MDNFACRGGYKITNQRTAADIAGAQCLPDLIPCGFWRFGFLKESMKGIKLSTEDQIVEAITIIWLDVTLDRLQFVAQEWGQRLNWVTENNGT